MIKIITIALFFGNFCFGQQSQIREIEKPIRNLFLAMKNADPQLLISVFAKGAIFQTVTKDGVVKTEEIQDFIKEVSKASIGDMDERISIDAIHTDGNLASVFTPYSLYYRGQFLNCGANSFQLVRQNNEWKILYLIDTRREQDCNQK